MWGYGHMFGSGLGFGLGWIFEIVFWGLIIWLLISLLRCKGHGCCGMRGEQGKGEDAQEILKKRYAKGEITKEQFESMKKDLHE